jgi:drug/metabolite transporter (DMT)-like permease
VLPAGEIAALATAASWCATSLFFAEASRRVGAVRTNLLRLPAALVLLSTAVAITGTSLASLTPTRVSYLGVSAVIGLAIGDLAYFAALRRLGARLALLVMSLAPVFAAVSGLLLLGERPTGLALAGIVVTLGGVAWVVSEHHNGNEQAHDLKAGVPLGILGAACQGLGLVLAKQGMAGQVPALTAAWVRMIVGAAAMWAGAAVVGRLRDVDLRGTVARAWAPLLGGAFFGPFLGVWLSMVAAKLTDVGVAATLMATNPVMVIPAVMVLEGYRPTWRAAVGTIVTVLGVALLFSRS